MSSTLIGPVPNIIMDPAPPMTSSWTPQDPSINILTPEPIQFAPISLGRLQQTHPRLDLARVRILQALYRGGNHVLGNKEIMQRIFPRYTYENENVYNERISRAYYENMFGLVINQIAAGLAQDPIKLAPIEGEIPDVDEYWDGMLENATHLSDDGTTQRSFDQVLRDVVVEGLVTGWAWVQADLPAIMSDVDLPQSLAEQEQKGDLRAYLVPWSSDQVTDWEEKDGRLLWVRTYQCETFAFSPGASRDDKTHVWTIWTGDGWARYEVPQRKNEQLPGPETMIPPKTIGTHSFKRVPWARFDVSKPGGTSMHIGDIIESLCRSYFNRQNGESFQWTQFYFQQLYEFLGPEVAGIDTMISEAQTNIDRARGRRGPGQVHVRGNEDRAEFIGPNMSGANIGREALTDLRDAIMRTTNQMALAQDTQGAMIRRSAESKKQDATGTEILLGAIGKRVVVLANILAKLLATGRGEADAPKFTGYERFDITDAETLINQAVLLEGVQIESATYQIERKYRLAITDLGDNTPEKIKTAIREELGQAITQDQIVQAKDNALTATDPLVKEKFGTEKDEEKEE